MRPRVDGASDSKHAIDGHGAGHVPLGEAALEDLVDYLAGSFPSQVEVLAHAAQFEDHLDHLTRDQARMLEHFTSFNRLQVVGGAGTGKTWLALEQARRRAAGGERVALLCYSRGLGRYLQRITQTWKPKERPAFVGLFHDLPIAWGAQQGADDDVDFFERILPVRLGELADSRPRSELFDTVVVDEAQDFGEQWWPALSARSGTRRAGGLLRASPTRRSACSAGTAARPRSTAPIGLDDNLRSTRQIAELLSARCRRRRMTRLRGRRRCGRTDSLDVLGRPRRSTSPTTTVGRAARGRLASPRTVALLAILAGGTRSRRARQASAGQEWYWDGFCDAEEVFYGHVLGFKGLERPVVMLAVNGFREGRSAARRRGTTRRSRRRGADVEHTHLRRDGGEVCHEAVVGVHGPARVDDDHHGSRSACAGCRTRAHPLDQLSVGPAPGEHHDRVDGRQVEALVEHLRHGQHRDAAAAQVAQGFPTDLRFLTVVQPRAETSTDRSLPPRRRRRPSCACRPVRGSTVRAGGELAEARSSPPTSPAGRAGCSPRAGTRWRRRPRGRSPASRPAAGCVVVEPVRGASRTR